ncbi:hypothetical protein ACWIGW_34950 [Nocardia brasiliensis]
MCGQTVAGLTEAVAERLGEAGSGWGWTCQDWRVWSGRLIGDDAYGTAHRSGRSDQQDEHVPAQSTSTAFVRGGDG